MTFPSRTFGAGQERRYFDYLRSVEGSAEKPKALKAAILESLGGRTLYYNRADGDEERTIIGCIPRPFAYAVGPEGVFHLECHTPTTEDRSRRTLRHWDARTGQDRILDTLDTGDWIALGLSASPDGRSILYTRAAVSEDLMMIENFR